MFKFVIKYITMACKIWIHCCTYSFITHIVCCLVCHMEVYGPRV